MLGMGVTSSCAFSGHQRGLRPGHMGLAAPASECQSSQLGGKSGGLLVLCGGDNAALPGHDYCFHPSKEGAPSGMPIIPLSLEHHPQRDLRNIGTQMATGWLQLQITCSPVLPGLGLRRSR
eukprot:2367159-Prorocentrum_lima.AAC.1